MVCPRLQVLQYGLDDDQHCIWWRTIDVNCMPSAYIVHPDYRELVRQLPPGVDNPSMENVVRPSGDLSALAEAAKLRADPHILFLDTIPDFNTSVAWPDGEADEAWKQWVAKCSWANERPLRQGRRRRQLEEQHFHWDEYVYDSLDDSWEGW